MFAVIVIFLNIASIDASYRAAPSGSDVATYFGAGCSSWGIQTNAFLACPVGHVMLGVSSKYTLYGNQVEKIVCCPATATATTTHQVLQVTSCDQSSQWSNDYSCANAYSSNAAEWATANEGVDSWIYYNFGREVTITSMEFQNRACSGCGKSRGATLEYDDGTTTPVTFLPNDKVTLNLQPKRTRWVKLKITDIYNLADNGARILTFSGYASAEIMDESQAAVNANMVIARSGSTWEFLQMGLAFIGLTSIMFQCCKTCKKSSSGFPSVILESEV